MRHRSPAFPRGHAAVVVSWRGVALAFGCATSVAAADPALNAELLSHVVFPSGTTSGVWGYTAPNGTELAILGTYDGTSFQDVTAPRSPHEVAFIPGNPSIWREIRTFDHYAYIVTEGAGTPTGPKGLQVVDLADPLHPRLGGYFDATFTTAHSLGIYGGYLYINGSRKDGGSSGMRILDLVDPAQPRDVGAYTLRYVHDGFVRNDIGYLCIIGRGLAIVDLHDKAHPAELSFTTYLSPYTHNAATNRDGTILFTTDETYAGHLRIWDVIDPRDPYLGAEWSAHPEASIHNVVVRGDSAYISYYTEGLQVLDISNPEVPRRVASYDTYPGISGGFNGCWGVYPFAKNRSIYLSDIQGGLFVVGLRPPVAVTLQDLEARAADGAVELSWRLARAATDRGALVVSRAGPGAAAQEFAERARLGLEARAWRDPDVGVGASYRYRLALDDDAGTRLLGEVQAGVAAPSRSRLLGNAPNPFNPTTRVRFELARAGDVALAVYDTRGRLLREMGARLDAGAHELVWDGRDTHGRGLPSGAYLYELSSGGWSARGRMTLVQ